MPLLERVSTLLRANLNDLLSKAEDPEKLARQLVLDMENQLVQVKTQVAVAIADQHLLKKKMADEEEAAKGWTRKAELAVAKDQDDMARPALERALAHRRLADGYRRQHEDQMADAETLRGAYGRLQGKLEETQARVELLIAQNRRNRAAAKASVAQAMQDGGTARSKLERLAASVAQGDGGRALLHAELAIASAETLEERFAGIEQTEQVEALLLELKERQPRLG